MNQEKHIEFVTRPYMLVTILCLLFALTLVFLENRMEEREATWIEKWSAVQEEKAIPCL